MSASSWSIAPLLSPAGSAPRFRASRALHVYGGGRCPTRRVRCPAASPSGCGKQSCACRSVWPPPGPPGRQPAGIHRTGGPREANMRPPTLGLAGRLGASDCPLIVGLDLRIQACQASELGLLGLLGLLLAQFACLAVSHSASR